MLGWYAQRFVGRNGGETCLIARTERGRGDGGRATGVQGDTGVCQVPSKSGDPRIR